MTVGEKVLLTLKNPVLRIVFLLFCLLVAVGVVRSVVTVWEKRGIVSERQAILQAEEAKHVELERQLREATSSAFIERQARDKLGLVKDGEQVVILDKSKIQGVGGTSIDTSSIPSWKQWWQLFF